MKDPKTLAQLEPTVLRGKWFKVNNVINFGHE
jgi:hypothetical protein